MMWLAGVTDITNYVYELIKANKELKEFPRKEYEKIKELFKLVRECEKGYKSFKLNAKVFETYDKAKELYKEIIKANKKLEGKYYEEAKKLEQKHIDLHEEMRESFKKNYKNYEEKILFEFKDAAFEIQDSYNRALHEIDDNFSKYCTLRPSEIGDLWGEDRIYDIFHKALKEEREITKEVVDRPNKEVKRILDQLHCLSKVTIEDVIESSVMIELHGRALEEIKKELSVQSMNSRMLRYMRYIRRHIKEIEAFKKEYEAFKAYEKVYNEDFDKVEEEVAFETFKHAFENIKEPCKRLINHPMSNVDSLFQAFEEFCRAREIYVLGVLAQSACANDMRYFLPFGDHDDMIKDYLWERADILSNFYPESEFIRKLKEFVLNHLRFKIFMTEAWNDLSFANIDCTYLKKVSQRVGPVKYIHSCALSLEINIYLCEKLNGFSIDVIQKTELIHKIKKVLIDNVHFKYIGGEEGLFTGYPLAKDYDCAFSEDIDSKLLEVLRELPDVPDLTATKKMLREEWKKWAKVHNAFFPCFSI